MGNGNNNDNGTEKKTYMVSQLVNVSFGLVNKTEKVSQLDNVSLARKGIGKLEW
jgi:hypothetical protein